MSISVTVSGEDSTSIILTQPQTGLISISGDRFIDVTAFSGDSATVIVSSGDPITITGNYSNYATGDVVRPPEISDFLTENQINSKIITATGDYNTLATNSFYPKSNPSGYITGVDLSDYVEKSETGAFYASSNPSGYITGVDLSAYTTEEFITGVSGYLQGQISSNDSEITEIVNSTGSFALKSETGSFISESQTGQFYAASNPSGYITGVDLSSYVQDSETGAFYASSNPSGFITGVDLSSYVQDSETGAFYASSNPSGFITGVDLSSYVQDSETGAFYASSNPSGFITGVDLSSYVQNSETGLFLVSGEDAVVNTIGVGTSSPQAPLHVSGDAILSGGNLQIGSTPAYSYDRSIKLHDNGVQFGARVSLIGTNDDAGPGLEMVTDGSLSKRTIIRHEGEGSNDYGLSFFTTNNGTVSEKVRFDGDGNVGIGQTNPAAPLSVNGNVLVNTNNPDVDGTPLVVRGNTDFHGIAIKSPRSPRIYFDEGADGSETELAFFGIQDTDNAFVMRNWGGSSNDLLFAVQGGGGRAAAASSEALQLFHNGQMTLNAAWTAGITDSQLYMHVPSASIKGITVDGAVGQTANLQEWKVNGTALSVVDSDGNVGIGTNTPSAKLDVSGDANIDGTLTVDKISLSDNSFIVETGDFTLSDSHKGATILLQNSAPMTVTIPAQVSGHTTTFIAETSNSVVFATGAGISGFNSFNSANQIAGIYGQAQIIFKSPEYAFLGGNVV